MLLGAHAIPMRGRAHTYTHTRAHRVAPSHTRSHTRTKHHNERHQHAVSRAHLQVRSAARRCSPRRGWAWRGLPRIVHISLAARGGSSSSSSSGSPSLGSPALGSEASTSPQFPAHGTHSLRIAYRWHSRVGRSTQLPAASDAPEYSDATCDGDGQGRNAKLCDKEARAVVLQQAIQAKQRLARAVATTMAQS